MRKGAERHTLSVLSGAISPRRLLVLDNVEQGAAAALEVASRVSACPHLSMLATSRAALRVSVEHEFPVPPLELPDPRRSASAAACGSRSNPDAVRRRPKGDLEARPARADAPRWPA